MLLCPGFFRHGRGPSTEQHTQIQYTFLYSHIHNCLLSLDGNIMMWMIHLKSNKQKNGKKGKKDNDKNSKISEPEVVPQLPCLNDSIGDPKCLRKLNIKIEYIADGYKETINHRSFTVLSLISQIGGFIGMFLGYSLLHLPQLAGFAANVAQNVATKNKQKDAKVLWNSIKQKKVLPKMNLVNLGGALDQKVNYFKESISLLVLSFFCFCVD